MDPKHDLDSEAFRAKNPFGQIPVIDDDGVVGTETGAILLYLARKSGKPMPHDLAGEAQVLRWNVAALSSVEGTALTADPDSASVRATGVGPRSGDNP